MDCQQIKHNIEEICAAQLARYPATQPIDLLKVLFQGEFGPRHLIADGAKSRKFLAQEYATVQGATVPDFVESIGFGFYRLHLAAVDGLGLSPETLHRIFELSALTQHGTDEGFARKVAALRELCRAGALPFNDAEIDRLYREAPALFRHSEAFRATHNPAYRVVKEEYCRHIALLAKIDANIAQNPHTIVAIDGDAVAGKTTLGGILRLIYNCNIIHMDHFFLRPEQRTEERLAQPGGNIDHERFAKEVLTPLAAARPFTYRPFDCQTWDFGDEITITPDRLTVIEGGYAHHPALVNAYDITAFLKIDPTEQMRRLTGRNAPLLVDKFRDVWIPMEKKYQAEFGIEMKSDLVFMSQ